ERRLARVVAVADGDPVGSRSDVAQQFAELARLVAVVQRRDEFDRLLQLLHVGHQLGLEVCVEHGCGSVVRNGGGCPGRCARDGAAGQWEPAAGGEGRVGSGQILPTRSSDGFSVFSPSFHFAGHTSPGCAATYCAALTLRSRSPASRPMPSAVTSIAWMMPSGSTTKVARSARPWPSRMFSKLLVITPAGSPIIVYLILPIASEVSCQALCEKWVSVETL